MDALSMEAPIAQFLFDRIGGYPQTEIFAQLQALSEAPKPAAHGDEPKEMDEMFLHLVCLLLRIEAAGLPPDLYRAVISDLQLRTQFFYTERIRAAGGARAEHLTWTREMARLRLEEAQRYREMMALGDNPYGIVCH
jgi:hypothetical protein